MQNILEFETVDLDIENNELIIIDQTLLPGRIEILRLTEAKDIWDAIHELKVRGAPAIGVAAAMGLYILSCRLRLQIVKSSIQNSSGSGIILIHQGLPPSTYTGH